MERRKKWREYWILNDKGSPVQVDLFTWAKWFGTAERIVLQETIGPYWISTIFLGIDHGYTPDGPPILWETMVFGGKFQGEMNRCAGSKEQAEAMHEHMVKAVCKGSGIRYNANRKRNDSAKLAARRAKRARRQMKSITAVWLDEPFDKKTLDAFAHRRIKSPDGPN